MYRLRAGPKRHGESVNGILGESHPGVVPKGAVPGAAAAVPRGDGERRRSGGIGVTDIQWPILKLYLLRYTPLANVPLLGGQWFAFGRDGL